jgi:hypothetical protein
MAPEVLQKCLQSEQQLYDGLAAETCPWYCNYVYIRVLPLKSSPIVVAAVAAAAAGHCCVHGARGATELPAI